MTFSSIMGSLLVKCANWIAVDARMNAKNAGSKRIFDSITVSKPIISQTHGEITIFADPDIAPHAAIFENGARAHPIDARNTANLVFWWGKMDTLFVGKHVEHPGMKSRPFMRPAASKNRKKILDFIARETSDAVRADVKNNSHKI